MCEGITLKGVKCKNAKHPFCIYHMPKDIVSKKCDDVPKQLDELNIECTPDLFRDFRGLVEFQRTEIRAEQKEHDELINTSVRNIETTALNIKCFKQSKDRGMILGEYISRNITNILIANSHINDDSELVLIDHDFLKQLTLSMSILMARDKENKTNSPKSFKSEYVQATERIGELKKMLKQKNIELDELRRVKKERKEIKKLRKELDNVQMELLSKNVDEMEDANVEPPAYSDI